jgi:LysR family transcriptional regulator, transcriptional activator of nhaA
MEWLNYHHLLYFWTVAKEGSIARASQQLLLAQPTISGQIHALEQSLGEKLFTRAGRNLQLTEMGRVVFEYADEIFSLGRELQDVLKGRPRGRPIRFTVGISDVVPKLVAYEILKPALQLSERVQLVCEEDRPDKLVTQLSTHDLDMVLTDAPVSSTLRVRAFSHLLGSCGVCVYAAPELAVKYAAGFPQSLDGAPVLLPTHSFNLRRSFDLWTTSERIRPRVVAEFHDSALLKAFGQEGVGLFVAPAIIEHQIAKHYNCATLGRLPSNITEKYYAISIEKRLKHPAVIAITEAARSALFGVSSAAAG